MTPKQKAKDLFVIFMEHIPDIISNEEAKEIAKFCATSCAQVTLEALVYFPPKDRYGFGWIDYYTKVKEEIKKL